MPDQARISNGKLSVGLCLRTGAWIELTNELTGENLIKNRIDTARTPILVMTNGDGGEFAAVPAEGETLPDCRPQITADGLSMTLRYPCLFQGDRPFPIAAELRFELSEDKPRLTMRARVIAAAEIRLQRCAFPCLCGVWLGQDHHDNVLVTPFRGGERISDPVGTLAGKPRSVDWRWQDYRWKHFLGGPYGKPEDGGRYVHEAEYAGGCSALFCDLSCSSGGMWLACADAEHAMRSLRFETRGTASPGLNFSFVHQASGNAWESPACTLALHGGNWLDAVDDWRAGVPEVPRRAQAAWFDSSPGLAAHYDLKYQSGEIVHRYADIPGLYAQAEELGLDHLLLAGWHRDGFDNGFPQYECDPELGREEALREAVRAVRNAGGHVSFYLNTRLCNTRYADRAALMEAAAERGAGGFPLVERYGSDRISFACMCPQEKLWREVIVEAASRLVSNIGADGLYLDQLAAAPPRRCRGGHGDPDGWNRGCCDMLREIRAACGPDTALIVEGIAESAGPQADGMLSMSLGSLDSGLFNEFYRYANPSHVLVEMMNPRKYSSMRPAHVALRSSYLMDRAFLLGSVFWVYDLEGDNSFRTDPPQHDRLRKVLRLKKEWLSSYGTGRYLDEKGILNTSAGVEVRCHGYPDGSLVLACANRTGTVGWADIRAFGPMRAVQRTLESPGAEGGVPCLQVDGGLRVTVPADELSLVRLEPEKRRG